MSNSEVKIFIGHSTKEFKDDIESLKEFLEDLGDTFDAKIKVFICEDHTVSGQDEINEKWIKPSSIAFFCFKDKVGDFSKEELEVAVEEYVKNKFNPQIFVYIQQGNAEDSKLQDIIEKLEKNYRIFYFDFDEYAIKLRFAQNVSQTLGGEGKVKADGRKVLIDDKPINLPIKELSAIKKNENYNVLQAEIKDLRNLRNEAEEDGDQEKYYQLSEQINAKIALQIQMEKDALKVYEYLNNQLKKENADEDAIRALNLATQGKIEEALALLPSDQLLEQTKNVVEAYNVGKQLVENAKESATKLIEKLTARIDILQLKINEEGVIQEIIDLYDALIAQSDIAGEYYYELEYTAFLIMHNKTEEAYNVAVKYVERVENMQLENEQQQFYMLGVAYNNLSNCCNLLSKTEESLKCAMKAIEVNEELVEIDRDYYIEDLADSYHNIATLCVNLSRSAETEEYALKAIELRKELVQKDREAYIDSLASTYTILASLYNRTSKGKEAIEYNLKAIEIYEEVIDKNREVYLDMLAIAYVSIAIIYNQQYDYEKSIEYNKKALELLEEGFKIDQESRRPYIAMCCMSMASIYINQDKYEDALYYNERAVELYEDLCQIDYERNVWQLCIAYDNLASIYLNTKKYQESEEMHLKTLALREELYEYDHLRFAPELAKTYLELGRLYQKMERNDDAIENFETALTIGGGLVDVDRNVHLPFVATCSNCLGALLMKTGEFVGAKCALEDAKNFFIELANIDAQRYKVWVNDAYCSLNKLYNKWVKQEPKEDLFIENIIACEYLYSQNKVRYYSVFSSACNDYAIFLRRAERHDEAIKYFLQAVALREEHLDGASNTLRYHLAITYNNTSYSYSCAKKHDDAEVFALKAIEIMEDLVSKEDLADYKKHLRTCYVRASWVYHDKGDEQKVKEYADKSKQYEEKQ